MKKICCVFLFVILAVFCVGALAASSGTCGEHLSWTLDDSGTLTISGTGEMGYFQDEYETGFGWDEDNVRKVMIGNGVTVVRAGAFNSHKNLESIYFSASVTGIGLYDSTTIFPVAFDCPNLKAYIVDSGNRMFCSQDGVLFSKDMKTLYCCPEGKSGKYTVPDKVRSIYSAAYDTSGGLAAFEGCAELTEIILPSGMQNLGNGTFSKCTLLRSISIPGSVKYLGVELFADCTSLANVSLSDGLETIGYCTFDNCKSLTGLKIPGSVKDIYPFAFLGCSSLTKLTVPCSTDFGAFSGCSSLTEVIFLEGAKYIEGNAFSGCTALKSLTIPDSLTELHRVNRGMGEGDNPFLDCGKLSRITVSTKNTSAIQWLSENGLKKALNIRDIPIADCTIAPIPDQEYTGRAIEPKVTVRFTDIKLKEGKDYTLSFSGNKRIGKAAVTVTGKGNCNGKQTVSFIINPKSVALSSLKAGKTSLTVRWKKGSGIDGYEIEYSLKKSFKGSKTVTVTGTKTASTVLDGLKPKKMYYVCIRAFKKVKGKKYYSEWSKVLSSKTK